MTDVFNWTGGSLNSSGAEATFRLLGATATIAPGVGNTFTTGNSFSLEAGSDVTVGVGTINFLNGSPIIINGSVMMINGQPGQTVEFTGPEGSYNDGKAKIELNNQGGLIIRTPIKYTAANRSIVNNGGNLEIKEGAEASFGSNAILGPPVGTPLKTDILQNSGTITIHSGCVLTSAWGAMEVKGGTLFASADGGASGTTSTIGCQFVFSGGTIRVNSNIGTLHITQDFYWLGGTFLATVDCGPFGGSDKITTDKKLVVGGNATLQVLTLGYDPLLGLPIGFNRRVVYAKSGIQNAVPNLPPSLTLQNPPGGPTFQLDLRTGVDRIGDGEYRLLPG